jgi:hypothetical protein
MPNLYSILDGLETYKIGIYKYYMNKALRYSMMLVSGKVGAHTRDTETDRRLI